MTFGDKSAAAKNRSSGFDYLRIALAISVVVWHTIVTTYGADFQAVVWSSPIYRLLITGILPSFFALSGFLVAGSLQRSKTLVGFLYLRAIRIFPALMVEITLSALILGPLLTRSSLGAYFKDNLLYSYFLNCFGVIHYELPGLFLTNPLPSIVNGQLWTVPFELECYIALSVLAFVGITLHKKAFSLILAFIVLYGIFKFSIGAVTSSEALSGRTLVACFLVGVFIYLYRDSLVYDNRLGWLAIAVSLALSTTPSAGYMLPFPVAYATVFVGLANPRRSWIINSGDYSYGIFLYGFPIQQAVVSIGRSTSGFLNCAISLPIVFALAFLSWHLWEKKVAMLKRYRPAFDRVFSFTAPGFITGRLSLLSASAGKLGR